MKTMSWFGKNTERKSAPGGLPHDNRSSEQVRAARKKKKGVSRRRFLQYFGIGTASTAIAMGQDKARVGRAVGEAAGNYLYNKYMAYEDNVEPDLQGKALDTDNPSFHVAGDSLASGTGNIVNGRQIPFSSDIRDQAHAQGYPRATAKSYAQPGSPMTAVSSQLQHVPPPKTNEERVGVVWTGHNYQPAVDELRRLKENPLGNIFDYFFSRRGALIDKFTREYEATVRTALQKLGTRKGILLMLEPFEQAPRLILILPDGTQQVLADLRGDSGSVKAQRVTLKELRLSAGRAIKQTARKLNREGYSISVQNPGKTIRKKNFGKSRENDQHPNAPAYQETAKGAIRTRRRFPS